MGTLILTKTKKDMNAIQTIVILLLAASISCQSALEAQNAEIAVPKVQPVTKERPDSHTDRQLVIIGDANVQEQVAVNAEKDSYSRLREDETAERMLEDTNHLLPKFGPWGGLSYHVGLQTNYKPEKTPGVLTLDELVKGGNAQMDDLTKEDTLKWTILQREDMLRKSKA